MTYLALPHLPHRLPESMDDHASETWSRRGWMMVVAEIKHASREVTSFSLWLTDGPRSCSRDLSSEVDASSACSCVTREVTAISDVLNLPRNALSVVVVLRIMSASLAQLATRPTTAVGSIARCFYAGTASAHE